MNLPVPVEIGASVRHVGDRFNADPNTVTMLAYTGADAYAFMDVRKNTRVTRWYCLFCSDKKITPIWASPAYPDPATLGAPRSCRPRLAALKFCPA